MPYLGTSPVSFPDFEKSRNYFRTGIGGPPAVTYPEPETQIAAAPATGGGGITSPTPPPATPPPPAAPPPAAPPPAAPPITSTAPFTGEGYTPPTLDWGAYQPGGTLQGALFDPAITAAQKGTQDVMSFAELFRKEAGDPRTYAGIGAESTLAGAVEGGPLDPARELVGAQYAGPAGLDPNAVGGLQFLGGQLGLREKTLGTGGGLTTAIGQTVGSLTPGEARFEAESMFTPEYRAALAAQVGAPIAEFGETLGAETTGAAEFAKEREAQEADIAAKAAEYLTGRRTGITEDLDKQIADALAQQQTGSQQFSDILGAEDPAGTIEALRKAQEGGFLAEGFDPGQFETEAYLSGQAAGPGRDAIINDPKYAALKDVPIGELGVDKKGRQTYLIPNEEGEMVDFRTVLGQKSAEAVAFKQRQGELEEKFAPTRGVPFPGGRTSGEYFGSPTGTALTDPLYFGDKFQGPEIKSFLNFHPGFAATRGNISSEDQRNQYNRINDLLGELDRISEDENVYKAATIGANIKEYLEEEAAALEKQSDTLDEQGKEWFGQVKSLRKRYRKAEREEKWGKVAGTMGAVGGGLLGAGLGPAGAFLGMGVGGAFGQQSGRGLARATD